MSHAVHDFARFEALDPSPRVRSGAATPLLARLVPPQRELRLKRSWMIGGYGRAMPRPAPDVEGGRRLLRPYELRLDQIIAVAPDVYELSHDQVVRD